VALAAALGAESCEIYSDVDGVYSADPRLVPEARRLSEISYEEMQEMAEAGARVLNAQAVEFAKDRGIALYARASAGGEGETVIRRFAPPSPGRVMGIAGESSLVLLSHPGGGMEGLAQLLARLDGRLASGKQLLYEGTAGASSASLVLSREELPDYPALKAELVRKGGADLCWREGVAAVSAIGAGINTSFRNVREALAVLAEIGTPLLGLSTSRFRISLLLEEAALNPVLREMHRRLVVDPPGAAES
jgi:aspartate kinase